jgi:hypothetical protein
MSEQTGDIVRQGTSLHSAQLIFAGPVVAKRRNWQNHHWQNQRHFFAIQLKPARPPAPV